MLARVQNDFTPEEEEEVRRENQVCCLTKSTEPSNMTSSLRYILDG